MIGCLGAVLVFATSSTAGTQTVGSELVRLRLEDQLPGDRGAYFGSVADADLLPDGSIVVLDRLNKTLYIFRAEQRTLDSIGRAGRGPGEFLHPTDVEVGPHGEIAVADLATGRVLHWTAEHRLLTSTRLPGRSTGMWWSEAGLIVRSYTQRFMDVTVSFTPVVPNVDATAAPVVTFPMAFADGAGEVTGVSSPFSPAGMTRRGRPVVAAPDTSYRIMQIGDGGRIDRVWKREGIAAVRRSPAEIEELREEYDPRAGSFRAELFRYKPRFGSLEVDERGRLWVLRTMPDGRPSEIDVFDNQATFLGTVTVGETLGRMVVRRDRVVGWGESPDWEPTVYVYRIEESASRDQ